jgi:hypothetical protein
MMNKKKTVDVYVGRRAVRGILFRPRLTVQRVGPWLSFEAEWGTRTVHVSVRRDDKGSKHNGNEREHYGDPRGPS